MCVNIPFSLTQTGFNGDDGSYVILTWVGDDTGVSILSFYSKNSPSPPSFPSPIPLTPISSWNADLQNPQIKKYAWCHERCN